MHDSMTTFGGGGVQDCLTDPFFSSRNPAGPAFVRAIRTQIAVTARRPVAAKKMAMIAAVMTGLLSSSLLEESSA